MLPGRLWKWGSVAADQGPQAERRGNAEGGDHSSRPSMPGQAGSPPVVRTCSVGVGVESLDERGATSGLWLRWWERVPSRQGCACGDVAPQGGALSLRSGSRPALLVPPQDLLWLLVALSVVDGAQGMLLVPLQTGLTTSMTIIISIIVFLFTVPIICKIIHVIRVQVNKIRNADIWGEHVEVEDDEDDEY
mmetsp:Transcript_117/g.296  ORF Transcript_117/g.296 Transcript_117/m.296 type:complete len:191 (+) Transcript_117:136-708(+)